MAVQGVNTQTVMAHYALQMQTSAPQHAEPAQAARRGHGERRAERQDATPPAPTPKTMVRAVADTFVRLVGGAQQGGTAEENASTLVSARQKIKLEVEVQDDGDMSLELHVKSKLKFTGASDEALAAVMQSLQDFTAGLFSTLQALFGGGTGWGTGGAGSSAPPPGAAPAALPAPQGSVPAAPVSAPTAVTAAAPMPTPASPTVAAPTSATPAGTMTTAAAAAATAANTATVSAGTGSNSPGLISAQLGAASAPTAAHASSGAAPSAAVVPNHSGQLARSYFSFEYRVSMLANLLSAPDSSATPAADGEALGALRDRFAQLLDRTRDAMGGKLPEDLSLPGFLRSLGADTGGAVQIKFGFSLQVRGSFVSAVA